MQLLTLSRINSAVLVVGVAAAAGHLLLPFAAGVPAGRRIAFVALMLGLGALRGWREARLRDRPPSGRAALALPALFAAASLGVALLGYVTVHGRR